MLELNPLLVRITRNSNLPLTLRKKLGRFIKPRPNRAFKVALFEQCYHGVTGNLIDDRIFIYGLREAATINLMRDILSQQLKAGTAPVYLDIGTNTGMHLLACAGLCQHAFGFEPWKKVRQQAQGNIDLNDLAQVKLFPFGLSDANANLPFHQGTLQNHGLGSFSNSYSHDKDNKSTKLEVRSGDQVIKNLAVRPSLIKIDVEGHEASVLRGLKQTLIQYTPTVIFEYSRENQSDFDTQEKRIALFGEKYNFFGIKRSREKPVLVPFNSKHRYENIVAIAQNQRAIITN